MNGPSLHAGGIRHAFPKAISVSNKTTILEATATGDDEVEGK